MTDGLKLDALRHAYRSAIEEFDVATAILAVHQIKRSEPTAEQLNRETTARGVLEEIRRLYLAAARAAADESSPPAAPLVAGALGTASAAASRLDFHTTDTNRQ